MVSHVCCLVASRSFFSLCRLTKSSLMFLTSLLFWHVWCFSQVCCFDMFDVSTSLLFWQVCCFDKFGVSFWAYRYFWITHSFTDFGFVAWLSIEWQSWDWINSVWKPVFCDCLVVKIMWLWQRNEMWICKRNEMWCENVNSSDTMAVLTRAFVKNNALKELIELPMLIPRSHRSRFDSRWFCKIDWPQSRLAFLHLFFVCDQFCFCFRTRLGFWQLWCLDKFDVSQSDMFVCCFLFSPPILFRAGMSVVDARYSILFSPDTGRVLARTGRQMCLLLC